MNTILKIYCKMINEICFLSATELINKLKSKEISVKDVVNSCLTRIKEVDSKIHAWVYLDKDLSLKKAEEIDFKIKEGTAGKFFGIPVGVKDIFNTEDMPNQMGSIIWKGYMPGNDARSVFNLKQEDALVLGKTVTAEFAVHAEGETLNPHNPKYSPGTSSSGSAVAVASYMVPLALGTQTGGSIIRPASYNGIYGMKPTFGLIPRTGILKTTDTLDTVGFFARTVEDLELLFENIRLKGHNYPNINTFLEDESRQKSKEVWKVALVKSYVWGEAEKYAQEALLNFSEEISKNENIELIEVDLPKDFEEIHDIHTLIYDKTLSYYFNNEFKNDKDKLSDIIHEIISRGNKINFEEYKNALKKQTIRSNELDKSFKDYDTILTLSTSGHAPKKGVIEKKDTSLIWTFCGNPTINLPVFESPNGLPFGAQIVARKYNDYLLLNFAKFLKKERYIKDGTNPDIK